MPNIMRFIIMGDNQGSRAFNEFARSVDRANTAVARNKAGLNAHAMTAKRSQNAIFALTGTVTGIGDAFAIADRKRSLFVRGLAVLNVATGVGETAIAALGVTIGAAASAFTIAGAAAVAYGAAAVPAIQQVAGVMKAQQTLDKARTSAQASYTASLAAGQKQATAAATRTAALSRAQQAYNTAMKDAPPPVRQFAQALDQAKNTYKAWAKPLAGPVLAPLTTGLRVTGPLLKAATPLTRAMAGAVQTLVTQASKSIRGGGLETWTRQVAPYVTPIVVHLGRAVGNLVVGIGHIARVFAPFAVEMAKGLDRVTQRFEVWARTLGSHSGFQAMVAMWRNNWPILREDLGLVAQILTNILASMAGLATPANSQALWRMANPLLALSAELSSNHALVQVLLYLWLIGKGSQQISSVFKVMQTGWGSMSKVLGWLTGGRVSLGMQAAGDTMLLASRNMQSAAGTMAAASGAGGKAGAAGRAGGAAARGGLMASAFAPGAAVGTFLTAAVAGSVVAVVAPLALAYAVNQLPWNKVAQEAWKNRPITKGGLTVGEAATARQTGGRGGVASRTAWKEYDREANSARSLADAWERVRVEVELANSRGNPALRALSGAFAATDKTASAARAALGRYGMSVSQLGTLDTRTKAARQHLMTDLLKTGVNSVTAQRDVDRLTQAIVNHGARSDQARAARRRLVNDIMDAWRNSQQGRTDMNRLADAIKDHGARSDQARGARRRLITDLISAGLDAKTARDLVNKFSTSVKNIPPGKKVNISVAGAGHFTIAQIKNLSKPGGKLGDPFALAGGGRIPGYGGGDKHLRLLEAGEAVVSKETTRAHAAELRSWGVPGMQKGGAVGDRYAGSVYPGLGHWTRAEIDKYQSQFVTATGKAMEAGMRAAMTAAAKKIAASGGRGSNAIVNDAMRWLGRIPYVWGGAAVGGADCSGFVQMIYGRHGISAPRTSEAQGAWVRRTGPVPGGLAFYNFSAGGPPPGHVAIVGYNGKVISQGGGMGPQLEPLRYGPLMWTGVPPGGFAGKTRGFAYGSWDVPSTGPAMVHRGEMVLPEALATAVRATVGGGGSGKVEELLAEQNRLLAALLNEQRQGPGRTAAGVSEALTRTGRRAAYSGMYGS